MIFKKTLLGGVLALALAAPTPGMAGQIRSHDNNAVFLLLVAVAAVIVGTSLAGPSSVFSTQNGPAPDLNPNGDKPLWQF